MAYFMIDFDGDTYMNREMYMRVNNIGEAALADKNMFRRVLGTTLVGPLTHAEVANGHEYDFLRYDVDKQIVNLVDSEPFDETFTVKIDARKIIDFVGLRFVKLADIRHPRKYQLARRMARVCLGGRGNIYVALGKKASKVDNAVVLMAK